MKLKIKVKVLTEGCMPEISEKGDWIDLKAAESIIIGAAQAGTQHTIGGNKVRDVETSVTYIPLGVAIELPKGLEAIIASRSGTPKKKHIFIPSGIGVVDNVYCGDNDQWMYIASPLENTCISKGERICQFRIQLSQKATMWQKLKWLFSSGIELERVEKLSRNSRGMNVTGAK